MAELGMNGKGGGIGPIKLLDGSSSTDESEGAVFPAPMSNFGFQVSATSTDAIVVLGGAVASSSDATKTALITFDMSSSGTDGGTQFLTGQAVSQVSATITGGASSGGASAWVSVTP